MDSSHYFEIRSLQGFNETEEMEHRRFVTRHFKYFSGDTQEEFEKWFAETEHFLRYLPPSYRTTEHQLHIIDQLLQYGAREIFLAYRDVYIRDLRSLHTLIRLFFSVSPSLKHISKYVWDYSWLQLYHDFAQIVQQHRCAAPIQHPVTTLRSTSLFQNTEHEIQFRKLIMSNCKFFDGDPEDLHQWLHATGTFFAQQALTDHHQLFAIRFLLTGHALDLYLAHDDLVHNFDHLSKLLLHVASAKQTSPATIISEAVALPTSPWSTKCSNHADALEPSDDWPTSEQATSTWDETPSFSSSIPSISLEPAIQAVSRQSSSATSIGLEPAIQAVSRQSSSATSIGLEPAIQAVSRQSSPSSRNSTTTQTLTSSIIRRKRPQRFPKHGNCKRQCRYGPKARHTQTDQPTHRYCYLLSISQLLQQKSLRLCPIRRKVLYIRFKMKHTSYGTNEH